MQDLEALWYQDLPAIIGAAGESLRPAPGKVTLTSRLAGGGGAQLPEALRAGLEAGAGADLSRVRIHTGAASAATARELGAQAFTVGSDIHFGAGRYHPDDPFGVHLLAHEVAHTVQQDGASAAPQCRAEVSSPHDAGEVEADAFADAFVAGRPSPTLTRGASPSTIRRSPEPSSNPAASGAAVASGVTGMAGMVRDDVAGADQAARDRIAAADQAARGDARTALDAYIAALAEHVRHFGAWRIDQWLQFVRRTAPWCELSAAPTELLREVYQDALAPGEANVEAVADVAIEHGAELAAEHGAELHRAYQGFLGRGLDDPSLLRTVGPEMAGTELSAMHYADLSNALEALGTVMAFVGPFVSLALAADEHQAAVLEGMRVLADWLVPMIQQMLAGANGFVDDQCRALQAKRGVIATVIDALSAEDADRLRAQIEQMTAGIAPIDPGDNRMRDRMLSAWVREHAGSNDRAAGDVAQTTWAEVRDAAFGDDRTLGVRLFTDQLRRELARRGFAADDVLAAVSRRCDRAIQNTGGDDEVMPADADRDACDGMSFDLPCQAEQLRDGFESLLRSRREDPDDWDNVFERAAARGTVTARIELSSDGRVCSLDHVDYQLAGTALRYTVLDDGG